MPRILDPSNREVIEIHAPWWSSETTKSQEVVTHLVGTYDEDGVLQWKEESNSEHYKEHVVLYVSSLESDREKIQERMFAGMKINAQNSKPKDKELAKMRIYAQLLRISEMTDDSGQVIPLNNSDGGYQILRNADTTDTDYIQAAIEYLDKKHNRSIPIFDDDIEESDEQQKKYLDGIAKGVPEDRIKTPQDPETIARDHFRKNDKKHLQE